VGVAQTFIFNKRWSFRHDGTQGAALIRYCVAYGLGYVINLAALFLFVDRFGYPHQIVQGVLVLMLAAFLFVLQKFWVFRSTITAPAAAEPRL
jgi:putative flippase GtrA